MVTRMRIPRPVSSLIHFIFGLLTASIYSSFSPYFAILLYLSFHIYEFVEYFITTDKVYLDLREYYAGLAIGAYLITII